MCQNKLSVENGSTDHGGRPAEAKQSGSRNRTDEAGFYAFRVTALDTLLPATY